MFEETRQHLANEASVLGKTLEHAPGAIFNEVLDDWKNHRTDLIKRTGSSAIWGLAAGIAVSKIPSISKYGLAGLAAYTTLETLSSAGSLLCRAWGANTKEQRGQVVAGSLQQIGQAGASALETSIGFGLGGSAGIGLNNTWNVFDKFPREVSWNTAKLSDRLLVGPGVEQLPKSLLNPDNTINLIGLSDELAARHPWKGVEVGRSVRLSNMKAGPLVEGNLESVRLLHPWYNTPAGRVRFHTHPVFCNDAIASARPSVPDVLVEPNTGIVRANNVTSIYRGLSSQFIESIRSKKPFEPSLDAVVLDKTNGLAVRLHNSWDPQSQSWQPAWPDVLSYKETMEALSKWDSNWSRLDEIPTVPASEVLNKPGGASCLAVGIFHATNSHFDSWKGKGILAGL